MPELYVQASNISLIESVVTYTCGTSANLITLTLSILLKDDINRCNANAINQLKKAQISTSIYRRYPGVLLLGA